MKFDYILGNPPYQDFDTNRSEMPPIYHLFYDEVSKISNSILLITPARFLFDAGKTPTKWNQKMLNDAHFKVIEYYPNSKDVFSDVEIKGGVAITTKNFNKEYNPIRQFFAEKELRGIVDKVLEKNFKPLSEISYSNTSYKYDKKFFQENPELENRVSGGSRRYLASSVFNVFHDIFALSPKDGNVEIIGRKDNKKTTMYFPLKYLNPPKNFDSYKVYISSSNGSGNFGEKLTPPFVGKPLVGATETYMSIGNFKTIQEAENLIKYIKTKFLRTLLGTKKVTQGNKNPKVWSNIPLQNFSESSDIDWSKSISEIDQQLYKKYNLSPEEISFIETRVKEMD